MLECLNPVAWLRFLWSALPWYLALQGAALLAWPLVFGMTGRLADRGYGLAKGLGLFLVAWLTWVQAHGLVPFSARSVQVALLVMLLLACAQLWAFAAVMAAFARRHLRGILITEAVLLVAFCVMGVLRAQVPEITFQIARFAAEKFTDFATLNGLLASKWFPPQDPWLSGFTMNYYYFGHMLWAVPIKLTGYAPEVGYNLAMASAFGLVCALSFSLGWNLTHRLRGGWLALVLIPLASNIDGLFQTLDLALRGAGRALLGAVNPGALADSGAGAWYEDFSFWRSSRAIEHTINEFPAFSFLLGDLHAHVSSLVLLLTLLPLLLAAMREARIARSMLAFERGSVVLLILIALLLGGLYAANSWDAASMAVAGTLLLWSARLGARSGGSRFARGAASGIESVALMAVLLLAGVKLFFYAFSASFRPPSPLALELAAAFPFVHAAEWPVRLVQTANRSHVAEFVVHWALLLLLPLAAVAADLRGRTRSKDDSDTWHRWAILALAAAVAAQLGAITESLVAPGLALAVAALTVRLAGPRRGTARRLLYALLLACAGLALVCELIYYDDIFDGAIERINTVFKLYYAMWVLAAAASIVAFDLLWRGGALGRFLRRPRGRVAAALFLAAALCYFPLGLIQRVSVIQLPLRAGTPPEEGVRSRPMLERLDGLRYLEVIDPGDYAAIRWIRDNVPPDIYLLEVPGTQYQYAGRISTNTGRPALGGWLYHEWGWRGSAQRLGWERVPFPVIRDRRTEMAAEIYTTTDTARAGELLRSEHLEFIVVGAAERHMYPNLDEAKFTAFADPVFAAHGTHIYRMRDFDSRAEREADRRARMARFAAPQDGATTKPGNRRDAIP